MPQGNGALSRPLVSQHTVADPIVPARQEIIYRGKVLLNDNLALHDLLWSESYGHCNFSLDVVIANEHEGRGPPSPDPLPYLATNSRKPASRRYLSGTTPNGWC